MKRLACIRVILKLSRRKVLEKLLTGIIMLKISHSIYKIFVVNL